MDDNFLKTPLPPDITDLSPERGGALSAAARADGFAIFELDGAQMKTKPELMAHVERALCFPGDFGRNWDAMIDYLGDMAAFHKNAKILILVKNSPEILKADPALYADLRTICGRAGDNAREWSKNTLILKFAFIF